MKIYVQFSDDGQHIRKWDFEPFEGGLGMAFPDEGPWRCFHCGDWFTDRREAQLHFGGEMDSVPACKIKGSEGGLVRAIRDAQLECAKLLQQLHNDGGEVMQAYHSMSRRFSETARSCEETGFQRGVDQSFDPIRALLEQMDADGGWPGKNAFIAGVRELIEGKPE